MNGQYIGVDLGATNFNIGRVKKGMVVDETHLAVDKKLSAVSLIDRLIESIDSVFTSEVKGIGVGVPGIVDSDTGIIYDIQNIPVWKEVHLKRELEEKFDIPVALNNDANCFALGEKRFGKGQRFQNFVGLSIGTGLGMGVIINNELYNGEMCGAGEIGMLPYKDGIVEDYAGSFFFENNFIKDAKAIHELAMMDQPQAIKALKDFGRHLGEAAKMILYMYAPQAIILGGSISKAHPFFLDSMRAAIAEFAYPKQIEKLVIDISSHPNLPILGASALCE